MGAMRAISSALITLLLILLLYAILKGVIAAPTPNNYTSYSTIQQNVSTVSTVVTMPNSTMLSTSTTTAQTTIPTLVTHQNASNNNLYGYMLDLINADRSNYDLTNVTLSSEPSAQQHADSMLANNYFSHWDTYGMKPYMRYTLVGGRGSVDENIAFIYNSSGINISSNLQQMEYNFMYNDYACCNNGHRDNILNPYHNQVSIGVAYNSTSIYLVEDFINNYVSWSGGTPSVSNNLDVTLLGTVSSGYSVSSIQINFDSPVSNLTQQDFSLAPYNGSYNDGDTVAGIGYSYGREYFYFSNITTINATTYNINGKNFDISFNMKQLEQQYGPGEYTIMTMLNNGSTSACASGNCAVFIGAMYTVFVGSDGVPYLPKNV